MKPNELKSPFKWQDRKILIHDRVWYVPDQYENFASFSFPGWSDPSLFDQNRPIRLEFCSGNGAWVAAKAQAHPNYNWVAVERKFERVKRIWSKIKNYNLSNLLTVCSEGHRMTRHYIPDESVQAVYINFPDPWPKKRHWKNRIVQIPFIHEVRRILQPGGVLTLVTDDAPYSRWMIETLHKATGFQSEYPDPYYVSEYTDYGTSFFEDLWRQKGKTIHYHAFRKLVRCQDRIDGLGLRESSRDSTIASGSILNQYGPACDRRTAGFWRSPTHQFCLDSVLGDG